MSKRKPYTREMTATWWMSHPWYKRYMLREGTCVLVAAYTLALICALAALVKGPESWNAYVNALRSPVAMGFHALCLIAVLIHTGSWFNLTPKTMDLWIKDKKVEDRVITLGHYGAFALVSVVLLVIIGGWL